MKYDRSLFEKTVNELLFKIEVAKKEIFTSSVKIIDNNQVEAEIHLERFTAHVLDMNSQLNDFFELSKFKTELQSLKE